MTGGCPGTGGQGGISVVSSSAAISVSAASASFKNDVVPVLAGFSLWTVNVDSGVSDFNVSGSWESTAWTGVVGDILDGQGHCWSANTQTHTITISNC